MPRIFFLSFVLVTLLFLALAVSASVPQLINYQGRLTNSGGEPFDGTISLTFTIYDDSTGGNTKWSETQGSVVVANGLFNVLLGSVTPIQDDIFNGTERHLGIQVGTNAEITPRSRLVTVPWSYRVGTIDGSGGGVVVGDVNIIGSASVGAANNVSGTYGFASGMGNTSSGNYGFAAGQMNHATNICTSVGGGSFNRAEGSYSVVGGGGGASPTEGNIASGGNSTVGGGQGNEASGNASVVGGGLNNSAAGGAVVGGGTENTAGGSSSVIAGGSNNVVSSGYGLIGGGSSNQVDGISSVICGGTNNTIDNSSDCFLGGGNDNAISGSNSTIAGGISNSVNGLVTTITGGDRNVVDGNFSFIGGGTNNHLSGDSSVICGGSHNTIFQSPGCFIGGGGMHPDGPLDNPGNGANYVRGQFSLVVGGADNYVSGEMYNSIFGGERNSIIGSSHSWVGGGSTNCVYESGSSYPRYSVIGGGELNKVTGSYSFCGSGFDNDVFGDGSAIVSGGFLTHYDMGNDRWMFINRIEATAVNSFIGTGWGNRTSDTCAVVLGGVHNYARGKFSIVVGGGADFNPWNTAFIVPIDTNCALGDFGTIVGGKGQLAAGDFTFIGGGAYNRARGTYSVAAGGGGGSPADSNLAGGNAAFVGAGARNAATGDYSVVTGGYLNKAAGDYSFAGGRRAKSNHDGSFVWADGTNTDFSSTNSNQFLIRANGGVGINTDNPQSALHIGGTAGVDGIIFPDGTKQTTAATGAAAMPSGGIIMWSGTLATIPVGWALCDGTNGTPNLTDRFIYGISSGQNPGTTGGNTSHTHSVNPAAFNCGSNTQWQQVYNNPPVAAVAASTHTHSIDVPPTTSSSTSHLPPYYKLAFIIKL